MLQEGWCDTGDQGFFYAEDLYPFGRATDIIIIRGRNYDPGRSNTACTALPACGRDVQAFGMADLRSVRIASWCWPSIAAPSPGAGAPEAESQAAIQASCNLHLSELVLLPPGTLPRTSSGKMRRREAWRLWHAGNCNHLERRDCLRCSGKPWRAYGRITKPAKNVNDREAQRAPGASSRVDCGWRARRTCHGTDLATAGVPVVVEEHLAAGQGVR